MSTIIPDLGEDISLYVDGWLVKDYTKYTITRAVLEQPSTISFTIGNGDVMAELLNNWRPLMKAEVRANGITIWRGEIEDFQCSNRSGATELNISGRDSLRKLVKNYVTNERAFSAGTYLDMVRQVVALAWEDDKSSTPPVVVAGNEANRFAQTKVENKAKDFKGKKAKKRRVVEVEQTNMVSASGAKVQYEKFVCQIGQTWFDFLVDYLKRAGLYLMGGVDGSIILTIPDPTQQPLYQLSRARGNNQIGLGRILYHDFANRTSAMHAYCTAYGKGKPNKTGQFPISGDFQDVYMIRQGFDLGDRIILHDSNMKDTKSAQYLAKRHLGAQRRANRTLVYTVPGHRAQYIGGLDKYILYTPDTTVKVDDYELSWPGNFAGDTIESQKQQSGINANLYVEKVVYSRDATGGTSTDLSLMTAYDVQFLGEDPEVSDRELHNTGAL